MTTDQQEGEKAGFVVTGNGPGSLVAFFEDDGATGYLYLFDDAKGAIIRALWVYNRSPTWEIVEDDVFITWSTDLTKCGVVIWQQMRAVMDVTTGAEHAVPITSRDTPGLTEARWLDGFERE